MIVLKEWEEKKDRWTSLSKMISSYHLQERLVTNRSESGCVSPSLHVLRVTVSILTSQIPHPLIDDRRLKFWPLENEDNGLPQKGERLNASTEPTDRANTYQTHVRAQMANASHSSGLEGNSS